MFSRIRVLAGGVLAIALVLCSSAFTGAQERALERAQRSELSGTLGAVDIAAGTITVAVPVEQARDGERRAPATTDKTFTLAKDVEVVAGSGGGRGERGNSAVFKAVKLSDLASGIRVALSLSSDQKAVASIVAEGPTLLGRLSAVDAAKKALTVALPATAEGRGREAAQEEEKTFTLAPDAEIAVDDGRGTRFSVKEAQLADLQKGALVTVRLFVDMSTIQSILAEGPSYHGTVKALDNTKSILTLTAERRGESAEEYVLVVANDAVVLLDDGKGRRLSLKPGKLADVPLGSVATVKMSADQSHAMQIRVEGTTLTGQLKSVDAAKNTIVITINKGRGEDPEEKTLTVAGNARITFEGNETKLADLKTDDGPSISLRMSLDGKSVQAIACGQSARR